MADDVKYPGSGQNIWTGKDGAPVKSYNIDRERRTIDVASDILYLQPSETPFLVIGGRASKKPAKSLEVVWYDKEPNAWWTKSDDDGTDDDTDGVIEADATEFDVVDANVFRPKDVIKVARTGEVMIVSSIDGDTLTVKRGYGHETGANDVTVGGTEAADIYTTEHDSEDADNLMRMGNAMEENSLAPEPRAAQPSKFYNYVQTFRSPFSGSYDDAAESKRAGGSERERLMKEAAVDHRLDIERALVFGERNEVVSDETRMMGGLFQFINDQRETADISGSSGEANFESFLEDAFWYGSKTKLFLTSPRVGSELNQFARDRIETTSGEETYGLRLNKYISFHGDLYVATSQMFEKEYRDKGVVLDMEHIDIMPYDGEDTTLHTNIQEPDRDGWKDEFRTKMTLRVRKAKTHRILEGALG